jgi:hypothetical protein
MVETASCHFRSGGFQPVFWIHTGFSADPDPAFLVNADQDPGFDDKKIEKNLRLKKISYFVMKN